MAAFRQFASPIRALSSIPLSNPYLSLSQNPGSRRFILSKIWPKSIGPILPVHAPRFQSVYNMRGKIVQNLNLSGRKLFVGSFLGLSAVTGIMCSEPSIAYAMDDHYVDSGETSGFLKDDLHTFWSLARKFQMPAVLLITVLLGWRHPITLAINVALLLFCTKPSPLSIYMFIEQLRQRDMRRDFRLHKTKFLYTKDVKVKDYKIMCLAEVELREAKLDLIGILGSWWIFRRRDRMDIHI